MGKKQRERKLRKEMQKPQGRLPTPSLHDVAVTPQAEHVIERLVRDKSSLDVDRIAGYLKDSARLRDEPEFRDLHFPYDIGIATTKRILPAYLPRIRRAMRRTAGSKDDDLARQIHDQARIEIIDELATPEFRKDFMRRFDRLVRRLLEGTDERKIETAFMTRFLMSQPDIPWGIVGLVLAMYEKIEQASAKQMDDEHEQLLHFIAEQGLDDPTKLAALLEDPRAVHELAQKLETHPELADSAYASYGSELEEFENALVTGEVELDLFEDKELEPVAKKMEEYFALHPQEVGHPDTKLTERIIAWVRVQLETIMTPERTEAMARKLAQLGREWTADKNEDGAILETMRRELEKYPVRDNRFLITAFLGQLRRRGLQVERDVEDEMAGPVAVTRQSEPPGGLRTRLMRFVGKRD